MSKMKNHFTMMKRPYHHCLYIVLLIYHFVVCVS